MAEPRTLPRLLETNADRYAANTLMFEKRGASYTSTTYREIRERVHWCAAGLMSLGIRSGDRLALIAEGRNDWVVAELGMLYAGATNVPLSVKIDELNDLKFRLAHAGSREGEQLLLTPRQAASLCGVSHC